jgi:type IV secretory pathway VirB2 component (pilin)
MNKISEFVNEKITNLSRAYYTVLTAFMTWISQNQVVYAQGEEVQARVNSALQTIQGVLTGLIVTVGIVVALFIIIKRMPSADDPHEKSEVYKSVGRVLGLVAIGAAIVWVVPWVYSLFQ